MPLDPTIWNPGLTGPAGADGNTILNGVGAPSNSIGVDNDFYLDTATYDLYGPKTGGVWTTYVNLMGLDGAAGIQGVKGDKGDPGLQGNDGPAGTNGATILAGLGPPDAGEGANGDMYFDITNKDLYGPKTAGAWGVGTSLNGEDAVLLSPHYATRTITVNATNVAVTAASPTDLTDPTDYIQLTGIFDALPSGIANGITQQTNSLTITRTGIYLIQFWGAVTSSINNTNIAFKFAINGTVSLGRRPWARIGSGGDRISISAHGIHQFTAGDVISLWVAADQTANINLSDAVFSLQEVIAGRHQYDIYDEGLMLVEDSIGINFAGAGVTVTESPTGVALVTIADAVDFTEYKPGVPTASQIMFRIPVGRAFTFPINMASSYASATVAATGVTNFDLRKNGVSFGTMSFAAAATTATFTAVSATSFVAGDVLELVAPVTPDGTLANIGFYFTGSRV